MRSVCLAAVCTAIAASAYYLRQEAVLAYDLRALRQIEPDCRAVRINYYEEGWFVLDCANQPALARESPPADTVNQAS